MTNIKRYGRDQALIPTIYDEKIQDAQFKQYDKNMRTAVSLIGSILFILTMYFCQTGQTFTDTTGLLATSMILVVSISAVFNRVLI